MPKIAALLFVAVLSVQVVVGESESAEARSSWVRVAADGHLLYARDEKGNRIPDFGMCGFRASRDPIPDVPVKETISPGSPDDRAAIQAAIDRVSALPIEAGGLRGAVLLKAGTYRLSDTVTISASGVVLRGEGSSESGTVLRATSRRQYTLISIAGAESSPQALDRKRIISDAYVPVGSWSVRVNDAAGLSPGDQVMVQRPSTSEWIHTIGMDGLTNPWKAGDRDCVWERVVVRIEGHTVFLNAPITTAIDARFGGGKLWKYRWPQRVENCGIENLRGVSETDGTETDEQHGWIFISVQRATDCWVRKVAAQHFGYACVAVRDNSRAISVLEAECLDPVSQAVGGRRYGFLLDDSQLCLVKDCRTRNDRHQFVTGSNTCGPNAFVDGISESAMSDAGPHHRWASGNLWDSINLSGGDLNIRNRGNSGSGHGWAGANCVLWNCRARGFVVQNPPTARNWCIGGIGEIRPGTGFVGPHDAGTVDSHGAPVVPVSLFAAQHHDLSADGEVRVRESVVGQFDSFADGKDDVPVDAEWNARVSKLGPVTSFDAMQDGGVIPWTHAVELDADESIVSATLSVCIRPLAPDGLKATRLYVAEAKDAASLDEAAIVYDSGNASVVCFDLTDKMAAFHGGKVNVAMSGHVAVDWAVLEFRVSGGWANRKMPKPPRS